MKRRASYLSGTQITVHSLRYIQVATMYILIGKTGGQLQKYSDVVDITSQCITRQRITLRQKGMSWHMHWHR